MHMFFLFLMGIPFFGCLQTDIISNCYVQATARIDTDIFCNRHLHYTCIGSLQVPFTRLVSNLCEKKSYMLSEESKKRKELYYKTVILLYISIFDNLSKLRGCYPYSLNHTQKKGNCTNSIFRRESCLVQININTN